MANLVRHFVAVHTSFRILPTYQQRNGFMDRGLVVAFDPAAAAFRDFGPLLDSAVALQDSEPLLVATVLMMSP